MYSKTITHSLLIVLGSFIFLQTCKSPEKLMATGDYDEAIVVAAKKLAGKKKKKEEIVDALVGAFHKANQRDMELAERLKVEGRPENWERIYRVYRGISKRQARVEPLLPLIDEHRTKADFRFIRTATLEAEAKQKAVAFYYETANELLADARSGDKAAARRAMTKLEKVASLYSDTYRDTRRLMQEAEALGITHVLLRMNNRAEVMLPTAFERELLSLDVYNLDRKWKVFHTAKRPGLIYDYEVAINLTHIDVSPELIKEREYQDAREIEDGFEYVLDENGNVMKDTLGNDIKVPKKVFIRATIFETYQSKAAFVEGVIDFIDLRNNRLLDTERFNAEAVFENVAANFKGDRRALSEESRTRCKGAIVPFPSHEAMLFDAAEHIKPIIKRKISGNRLLS